MDVWRAASRRGSAPHSICVDAQVDKTDSPFLQRAAGRPSGRTWRSARRRRAPPPTAEAPAGASTPRAPAPPG
eukprot:3107885-Alexandrium_andersonii.AAC.1